MKRFLPAILAISSILSLAALVEAGDHPRRSENQRKQQKQYGFGGWGGISEIVSGFKKHHGHKHEPKKDPIPIDPGRGDGRNPVDPAPVTPPPARDGFVWVKDHWERERAPKKANPYPADVVVRDHRTTTGSGGGGVIVRDHRTPSTNTGGGVIVRDHRTTTGNASGGTIIRDHRTTTDWAPGGTTVRDHRTASGNSSNASGGTTVIVTNPRPANAGPVIRDHRTKPVVRDHRTGR